MLGGQYAATAAGQLGRASAQLRAAGAPHAADRILGINAYAGRSDFATLKALADPDLAADELAGALQRPVRRLHTTRNALALVPLLLTWIALGFAAIAYRNELSAHPDASTKPFLLLWEQGFGSGFPSFALVAVVDFMFLAVVLGLTVLIHGAEGAEARRQEKVLDTLYTAMDTLEAAVRENVIRTPASAQEWVEAADRVINRAVEETRVLAQTGQLVIEAATTRLAGIQDQGRDFIGQFAAEVAQTLAAVRADNEQFINRTTAETRETLQRLVKSQMEPVVDQLNSAIAEFRRHQETTRDGVAELTTGVVGIRDAARELAVSAQAYNRIADSMTENLAAIKESQQDYATRVASGAESMATSATAMGEFHGSLREMHESIRHMATDITSASTDLESVQRKLADASDALTASTSALGNMSKDLHAAATSSGVARRHWHWLPTWKW
jgi:hypothetical protein